MTMTLIEHKELASAQASIEFTNIPQTYTDLMLVVSLRSNRASTDIDSMRIGFNSVTPNSSVRVLYGTTGDVTSQSLTNGRAGSVVSANATASTFSNTAIYIPNYTSSSNKSYSVDSVAEANASTIYSFMLEINAGLWSNTAAITSIQLIPTIGSQFVANSSATLYGILKGSDGIVTTS